MNQNNKHINIDSALNQILEKHSASEGGDYNDFLFKLSEHDAKNTLIDDVLERKLIFQQSSGSGSFKRIIALIWYRRIRNASLVLLLLFGIGYITNKFSNSKTNKNGIIQVTVNTKADNANLKHNSISKLDSKIEKVKESFNNQSSLDIPSNLNLAKPLLSSKGKVENSIMQMEENPLITLPETFENNVWLEPMGFKKLTNLKSTKIENTVLAPLVKLSTPIPHFKRSSFPTTGFIIGFNFTTSFQNYTSSIVADNKNVNKKYKGLTESGKKRSTVFNYGFSIERNIFKEFGLSSGINKLTIKQTQNTNYLLTEVPVFDIDGAIAGYIAITPERINKTIENKVDYIAIPLNLNYGFNIGKMNNFQFNLGSSLLAEMSHQTEKFDYKTLDLNQYTNASKRISLNAFQYGFSYHRNLKNNFILSLGFERQQINKINVLSDNTEKIKSNNNNFTFGLKYKIIK